MSSYFYLANGQLKTLGVRIIYKPVEIIVVMKVVHNQPSPLYPPKVRYAGIDAERSPEFEFCAPIAGEGTSGIPILAGGRVTCEGSEIADAIVNIWQANPRAGCATTKSKASKG